MEMIDNLTGTVLDLSHQTTELEKQYDYEQAESRLRQQWKEAGIYSYKGDSSDPVFSIDTPPPTISGKTHMGHVYGFIQQDFIARFKRMRGYNVFYPFGFDNNGLPTERFTERTKGVSAKEIGREKFSELCIETSKQVEDEMKGIWQNLGISADWSLLYRTISDELKKISQLSFLKLYEQDLEYRKKGPTLWCPECSTAVAQVQLEDKQVETKFNDLVFELESGEDLIISTTRPELLPACVSVFVHPDDPRADELAGKKARVPMFDYEVPIIKDERVELEKGSGRVMCCTFGDQTDMEWYYSHDLPLRVAIDRDGQMTDLAGKYEGMDIKQARKEIIKDLEESGYLVDQEETVHEVNTHDRCGTEIEFFITEQWFVKLLDNREDFLQAGEDMNWYPEHLESRYRDWIEGLQWDWSISRQRYYGIPIPVWYCKNCNHVILPEEDRLPVDPLEDQPEKECPECGSNEFKPESDVLDTWATSSLTPLINAGWDGENYDEDIFPMDLRPQGHDIISFWLFNAVVKSLYHTDQVPFEDVFINGMVLDPEGSPMSKSKGNIITPDDFIEDFPSDAIRFWAGGSKYGEDIPFKEKEIVTGEKFITKIWNAFRFNNNFIDFSQPPEKTDELKLMDKWMLAHLKQNIKQVTEAFDSYDFRKAREKIKQVFWNYYCDNYLEIAKRRLYDKENDKAAKYALYKSFMTSMKLLAPIMPYLTDKIYQEVEDQGSIHQADWPEPESEDYEDELEIGQQVIQVLSSLRKYKSDRDLPLTEELPTVKIFGLDWKGLENEVKETVKRSMQVQNLELSQEKPEVKEKISEVNLSYDKLGPKYGSDVKQIEQEIEQGDYELKKNKLVLDNFELEDEEFNLEKEFFLPEQEGEIINLPDQNAFLIVN